MDGLSHFELEGEKHRSINQILENLFFQNIFGADAA